MGDPSSRLRQKQSPSCGLWTIYLHNHSDTDSNAWLYWGADETSLKGRTFLKEKIEIWVVRGEGLLKSPKTVNSNVNAIGTVVRQRQKVGKSIIFCENVFFCGGKKTKKGKHEKRKGTQIGRQRKQTRYIGRDGRHRHQNEQMKRWFSVDSYEVCIRPPRNFSK